ncbi:diguanylate cyclase [Roseovarius sp. 217]|uniref:diguanylate cyclase n=1 Tax=Roseovarius sp. (strain 217) TaxID=314264 RepID=UPI00030D61E7|nr:diguanylate cyclase [Roseovarius sp. 217]
MSGRILIVDDLATNRIELKVKLCAAHYEVLQAYSAKEAMTLAVRDRPDLILANARLADVTATEFVTALRRSDAVRGIPVMLLQPGTCQTERRAALCAGADDILIKPVSEALLLARLRNLLRQYHSELELSGQIGTAQALGFAEAHAGFDLPGRIGIIARSRTEAHALQSCLAGGSIHGTSIIDMDHAPPLSGMQPSADIYLLRIAAVDSEEGLRLLAELKTAQRTRCSPVIVLLDAEADSLAVTLLDMGADDVINGQSDHEELILRIATQLRRKRRAERLRAALRDGLKAAMIDPLTGAHNRRFALPFLQRVIETSRSTGKSFAVMVADLDFFKQVNDRYGHAAGDRVLCEVTRHLRAHLREGDMLARIGGEEFLIVTPATTRLRAQRTADRLCAMIAQTPITLSGHKATLHVTVSIGVTMANPSPSRAAPPVGQLLEEADRALYAAKAQGRNTVTFCARSAA